MSGERREQNVWKKYAAHYRQLPLPVSGHFGHCGLGSRLSGRTALLAGRYAPLCGQLLRQRPHVRHPHPLHPGPDPGGPGDSTGSGGRGSRHACVRHRPGAGQPRGGQHQLHHPDAQPAGGHLGGIPSLSKPADPGGRPPAGKSRGVRGGADQVLW